MLRKNSYEWATRRALVAALGAGVALAALNGCSSDDDVAAASQGGVSGNGGSGGSSGGVSSGGIAGKAGAGTAGTAGSSEIEVGDAGAGGSPVVDLHLSAAATPSILSITAGGHDRFYGVTFDAAENIFAVGVTAPSTAKDADFSTVVAKFTPSGELDESFGVDGYAIRNLAVGTSGELARNIVVQSTGKIVVVATIEHTAATDVRDRDIALARFNPDGQKDATFGTDGIVTLDLSDGVALSATSYLADSAWGLALYPDDRLVVSGGLVSGRGTDTDFAIVRLSADGVRDASFGSQGLFTLDTLVGTLSNNASPRNLTLLPGTAGIIGAGYQPVPGFDTKPVVFHVTDDGKLDASFGVSGVFSEAVLTEQTETYAAIAQSDGKLVTTGYGRELSTETTDIVSMRLNADGTRDSSYGDAGILRLDIGGFGDNSRKLLALPDDGLVLVGGGRPTADNVDGVVVALTADGRPDTRFTGSGFELFDLGGPADFIWGVALSPSKTRIAAVGIKGVGTTATTGDDDAALLLMKLVP